MKKAILLILGISASLLIHAGTLNNVVYIPDNNFLTALKKLGVDINGDGVIQQSEASSFTKTLDVNGQNISDLTGINAFTNITQLYCSINSIKNLNVSSLTYLTLIDCSFNTMQSLDVSSCSNLVTLTCNNNRLSSLDVSSNTNLVTLNCNTNALSSINLSSNTNLESLHCNTNGLSSLDVSSNTALQNLDCSYNLLTSLNVSGLTSITQIYCNNNNLSSLDLSTNTALQILDCSYNLLTSLNVSGLTSITKIDCRNNKLSSLDVSSNTALQILFCYYNSLTSLNVSGLTSLAQLTCNNNKLSSLNLSSNTALLNLNCTDNILTSLNVSGLTFITEISCYDNNLSSLDLSTNTALHILNCSYNSLTNLNVTGLTYLSQINCHDNNLSSLDLSTNTALQLLYCYYNNLARLNVSGLTSLAQINCFSNKLETLDVSTNTALKFLYCSTNLLTTLDVHNGNNSAISDLDARNNPYLTCIRVDNVDYSNANWNKIDVTASFNTDCPGYKQWTGATDNDWNKASNWNPTTIPTATDNVIIPNVTNNPIINQDAGSPAVCNNIIVESSAVVTVNAAKALTVNGFISNSGVITLKSDITGTATLLNKGIITGYGTSNVEQYLTGSGEATPNNRYWYVSSPVTGATSATVDAAGTNILKDYDETAHAWQAVTDNTTILPVGTGYYTRLGASTTAIFTGTLNTGDVTLSPSRTGTSDDKRGFNLVGNPYPSYLDWDATLRTNLKTTMWYRSNNGSSMVFDTYNANAGVGTDNNGTAVNQFIPPMQAFWVRVDADGEIASLTFNNSMRSHQTSNLLKSETVNNIIRLKVTNGTNSDETILVFNTNAQNGLDAFDSEKMFAGDASIPELYTVVGTEKLTINGLESTSSNPTIPLGFKTAKAGTFTITANAIEGLNEIPVMLVDNLLLKTQDLTTLPSYSFSSDSTDNTSRFVLQLKAETTAVNDVAKALIQVYKQNNAIVISTNETTGKVIVSDVLGRIEATQTIVGTQTIIAVSSGIYFVKVQTATASQTKQIVIE